MKVAGEIRNKIYRYTLVSEYGIRPCVDSFEWLGNNLEGQIQRAKDQTTKKFQQRLPWADNHNLAGVRDEPKIGITRTCKQIWAESVPIYYAENTFSFETVHFMGVYLSTVSQERRRYIRFIDLMLNHIYVPSLDDGNLITHSVAFLKAFHILADCKALSKLHLGVHEATMDVLDDEQSQERRHYIRIHIPDLEMFLRYTAEGWRNRQDLSRLVLLGQFAGIFDNFRGFRNLEVKVREFKYQTEWDCPVPSTPSVDIETYRDEIRKWRREGRSERFREEPCKQKLWRTHFPLHNVTKFEVLLRNELTKVEEAVERNLQEEAEASILPKDRSLPYREVQMKSDNSFDEGATIDGLTDENDIEQDVGTSQEKSLKDPNRAMLIKRSSLSIKQPQEGENATGLGKSVEEITEGDMLEDLREVASVSKTSRKRRSLSDTRASKKPKTENEGVYGYLD